MQHCVPASRSVCSSCLVARGCVCCPSLPQSGPLPAFPHPPEFCAFVMGNSADLGIAFPVTPAMLGELGLLLDASVAAAFLEAVGGRFQYYL